MHFANSDGVYFRLLGDRAIFLDTKRDRYFAAPEQLSPALRRSVAAGPEADLAEELQTLVDAGLLTLSSDPSRPLHETLGLPAQADWPRTRRANPLLTAWALIRQLVTIRALQRNALALVLDVRREEQPDPRSGRSADALIAAHRAANLLFSAHDRCLSKSIALFDMLRAAGHRPRLVFGVRDFPFGAHAWVELEGLVASDLADRISFYRPIMVL